ncbi:MAG: hypothetical protein AB8I69_04985 [Anaerolineae bacterium]|jgi:hypothetical protein
MRLKQLFGTLILALGLVLVLAWLLCRASIFTAQAAPTDSIIYVDADADGANDGSSWTDAYTDLQDALAVAVISDEVWVAEGIYKPGSAGDRWANFEVGGVCLYGGFAATETLRTQRDWDAHVTVLSGDIDGNDITDAYGIVTHTANIVGDNVYHVVTIDTEDVTVIDGFFITGGNANDNNPDNAGGGMFIWDGSPVLHHLTFSGNYAGWNGGGMHSFGDPTLINVVFTGNTAYKQGGGMSNSDDAMLINVVFSGNAAEKGGGMHNFSGDMELINVTFSGNAASGSGGGLFSDDLADTLVRNCILWGNTASSDAQAANSGALNIIYSLVQGGCPADATCSNLLTGDPHFVRNPNPGSGDYGDLHLGFASPAIDAGDNTALPVDSTDLDDDGDTAEQVPLDLADNSRFVDIPYKPDTGNGVAPIVDIGAYETPIPEGYSSIYLPFVLRN